MITVCCFKRLYASDSIYYFLSKENKMKKIWLSEEDWKESNCRASLDLEYESTKECELSFTIERNYGKVELANGTILVHSFTENEKEDIGKTLLSCLGSKSFPSVLSLVAKLSKLSSWLILYKESKSMLSKTVRVLYMSAYQKYFYTLKSKLLMVASLLPLYLYQFLVKSSIITS